jgi:hypothetical protein
MLMLMLMFLGISTCGSEWCRCFGRTCCIHLQGMVHRVSECYCPRDLWFKSKGWSSVSANMDSEQGNVTKDGQQMVFQSASHIQ